MTEPRLVSNEDVAAYHEMLDSYARRYDGWHEAEYDDLYQEGAIAIIEAKRLGRLPSSDIVAKRMTSWVNKCARRGVGGYDPEEDGEIGVLEG